MTTHRRFRASNGRDRPAGSGSCPHLFISPDGHHRRSICTTRCSMGVSPWAFLSFSMGQRCRMTGGPVGAGGRPTARFCTASEAFDEAKYELHVGESDGPMLACDRQSEVIRAILLEDSPCWREGRPRARLLSARSHCQATAPAIIDAVPQRSERAWCLRGNLE